MSRQMTADETRQFLAKGTRTAKLSTVCADGRPHVAPVWFALDGEELLFTTNERTVKGRNLRRDSRVCLYVDDERPPYAFVIVQGTVTLSEEPAELLRWAIIGGRYMGVDQADAYGKRNGVPGELLARVTPAKVITEADVAG